jgi:uncharacterized membrane protein
VGWLQRNGRDSMMNHAYGWMGGGMWIWTTIGLLVVVLLVVAINKLSKKAGENKVTNELDIKPKNFRSRCTAAQAITTVTLGLQST